MRHLHIAITLLFALAFTLNGPAMDVPSMASPLRMPVQPAKRVATVDDRPVVERASVLIYNYKRRT